MALVFAKVGMLSIAMFFTLAGVQAASIASKDTNEKKLKHIPRTIPLVSDNIHKRLYSVAAAVDKVFKAASVEYWACAGTALGVERHGDIIPWDDDLDFCVRGRIEKGSDLFKQLKSLFLLENMRIKTVSFGLKIFGKKNAFADIFFTRQTNGKIQYEDKKFRNKFPNEYFLEDEVNDVEQRLLGDVPILAISANQTYCKRAFGNDFMTNAVKPRPHLPFFGSNVLFAINPFVAKTWTVSESIKI